MASNLLFNTKRIICSLGSFSAISERLCKNHCKSEECNIDLEEQEKNTSDVNLARTQSLEIICNIALTFIYCFFARERQSGLH